MAEQWGEVSSTRRRGLVVAQKSSRLPWRDVTAFLVHQQAGGGYLEACRAKCWRAASSGHCRPFVDPSLYVLSLLLDSVTTFGATGGGEGQPLNRSEPARKKDSRQGFPRILQKPNDTRPPPIIPSRQQTRSSIFTFDATNQTNWHCCWNL